MIFVGIMSVKKIKGSLSYFVADRDGSAFIITGSLLATIIGGSMTTGLSGLGFTKGLVGAWWMLVGAIGLFILAFTLSDKVRKTAVYTLPEVLRSQYGGNVLRVVASLLIAAAWLGIIAAQIIAAGKILSVMWPGHFNTLMWISAIVFIVYTVLGGQYSILRTDFIQAIFIVVGIIACAVMGIHTAGGLSVIVKTLPPSYFAFPTSDVFTVKDLLLFLLFVGTVFLVGPDIYSRILCARNPRVAKKSVLLTACMMIPMAFFIVFIGIAAKVVLPDIQPESAFPALIMHVVPAGLNGLFIATLLAAVMSSADTCLLTTSTIVTTDIIHPLLGGKMKDGTLLLVSRVGVIVIGLLSLLIALELKGVIKSLLLGYTIYSGGLVVPVILGFYREKLGINSAGAITSIIGGGILALFLKLGGHNELLLLTLPVSAILLFVGSYVMRGRYSPSSQE
jgi:SSS family solute:Na+ symporter